MMDLQTMGVSAAGGEKRGGSPAPLSNHSNKPLVEQVSHEPILVVDDKEENLYSIRKVLERDQFEVVTAHSGLEALRYLLKHDVSLILIDVQMPEMNGFETVQEIRQNARNQEVPILFITAVYRSDDFIDYGYSVGAHDYLTKPIDNRLLINKVRLFHTMHLQRKALELTNQRLQEERIARRKAEAREQFAAFQAGEAEMATHVIHNVGNSVQGLDGAFTQLMLSTEHLVTMQQGFQKVIDEMEKTESEGDKVRFAELQQLLLQSAGRLPGLIQELILDPCVVPSENIQSSIRNIVKTIRVQQRRCLIKLVHTPYSAKDLVEDLLLIMELQLEQQDIDVRYQIASDIPQLSYPKNPLLQSLVHLLHNSIDSILASEDTPVGEIDIQLSMQSGQFSVHIKDNGEGFDEAVQPKLFVFGFTTRTSNSGIGLHTVGNFAANLKGSVDVTSKGQGEGAEVTLLLPIEEPITH